MAASEKTTQRHERWKRQILQVIRTREDASKTTVRRETGLSMDSTLSLVDELIADGLVLTAGKTGSAGAGRKAMLLTINPEGCFFIGIRFSAGSISGVCMNFAREIICQKDIDLPHPPDAATLTGLLISCTEELISQLGSRKEKLVGLGIGAPGIIDIEQGIIRRYVHIPGLENYPIVRLLQEKFHLPVYLDHGVKCRTRALLSDPEYAHSPGLFFLQMSRGLNMCIAANGKILNGAGYMSGEIGHIHTEGNQRLCECGRRGCLETVASGAAICARAREAIDTAPFVLLKEHTDQGKLLNLSLVMDCAKQGCEGCIALLKQAGNALGAALASSVTILNPETVILSGIQAESPVFRQAVSSALQQNSLAESLQSCHILWLPANAMADALGAA